MTKLFLLIGILILALGCSSEPEIIYQEVVVTATPTYPLYTSGEAEAKIIQYLKGKRVSKYQSVIIKCYETEFTYQNNADGISRTGTFTWNMLPYDNSNYAWTLQRIASPKVDFWADYKWIFYERTETISSNDPEC